jgi:outer membrane biogenesis lipoprotein LolB
MTPDQLAARNAAISAGVKRSWMRGRPHKYESDDKVRVLKDYCSRGHKYTLKNTHIDYQGYQRCRRCRAMLEQARRDRIKCQG